MSKIHFTIDIDSESDLGKRLVDLARNKEVSQQEIIKRSVLVYRALNDLLSEKNDYKLSITDSNNQIVKDIILY